jgi:two-component system chemotaxis sensor kinase CheA
VQQTPIGDILVEQKVVHQELVEAAVNRQAVGQREEGARSAHDPRARRQARPVDRPRRRMVIAGAGANLLAQRSGQSDLMESTSVLLRLVEDIRDSALQLRMVQIGETFNRFNRVVRDSSREMGKDIDLAITGAETELDKSVVEKLGDPLMHLVRNAIDHGIESAAAARRPAANPRTAPSAQRLPRLGQHHHRSHRRRRRPAAREDPPEAIDKGLIDARRDALRPGSHQPDLRAGFSTADQVTNISGRGVGMDVVRRNIQACAAASNRPSRAEDRPSPSACR